MAPGCRLATIEDHGGNLLAAQSRFPQAPLPWLDLSTGINPHSYPLFELPATALTRLPEPEQHQELITVAAAAYGAPSAAHVVAAPGTQALLSRVASLLPPGTARVLSPTYAEHARVAAIAGHAVEAVGDVDALAGADLAIVVNPNNPDGRIVDRETLLALAAAQRERGGLLVVDEAFMDAGPHEHSLAGDVAGGGIVVLRSFGKFFGLAGVRLGFAITSEPQAWKLAAELGPWAVSGPALAYGLRALADVAWHDDMRGRLAEEAAQLDGLLQAAGFRIVGGTSLFRLVCHGRAADLADHLANRGILVRRFAEQPDRLRFGLPGSRPAFDRLAAALEARRSASPVQEEGI